MENSTSSDSAITLFILVGASPSVVWNVLVDPELIRKWMWDEEVEIVTDWKRGSPVIIRGDLHGIPFENTGVVMQAEPGNILEYTHLSSLSELSDEACNHAIIRFQLMPKENGTLLELRLSRFPTESIRKHLELYWNATLPRLREIAEHQA